MIRTSEINVSVRNLVEFVMRSGDIDGRFAGSSRGLEGTRAHRKIQNDAGSGYTPEQAIKYRFEYKGFSFTVEGRMDGVIKDESGQIVIDEIKTVACSLKDIDENYNPLHLAQLKCYAYMYCAVNGLGSINGRLTYCRIGTDEIKYIESTYSVEGLRAFFFNLIDRYYIWAKFSYDWIAERDCSIKAMPFPFAAYRRGQREMAVAIYRTIAEGKKLFLQAPTGIGKTISALFPAVKAEAEGLTSKIFYLTAKSTMRRAAEDAFLSMRGKGLKIKTITITAKEKICSNEELSCSPGACIYARGHFDRVNDAIMDIVTNEDSFTADVIARYAKKHRVCPFEYSLDIALLCDCIICDYNYAFDPRVYLKRFFLDAGGDYTFLVDEAHNLVDRSRDMFSAELYKKPILGLRRYMKAKSPEIYKTLNKLNAYMLGLKKRCGGSNFYLLEEEPSDIYPFLRDFIGECDEWFKRGYDSDTQKNVLDAYFDAIAFLRIADCYDENYAAYLEKDGGDIKLKLFCIDPANLLQDACRRSRASVFFSATLTPLGYFREILGGCGDDYMVSIPSPYDSSNLCLLIADDISTRYRDRDSSLEDVAKLIHEVISCRRANYLAFFPSYKYMRDVEDIFVGRYPDCPVAAQTSGMGEGERDDFLRRFSPGADTGLLGFAVLGGVFSEGIDLKGERLSGAIIVGVGLPQVSAERDLIMKYFRLKNNSGYEYAYMYPGMSKVLQAAGRVIRSETDIGAVLLIDERFSYPSYRRMLPKSWRVRRVKNAENVGDILRSFWAKNMD